MRVQKMASPQFPQVSIPIDNTGRSMMSEFWYQYFSRFFSKPDPEQSLTVGTSPFSYQAIGIGTVSVFGTTTKIEISRNGTVFYDVGVTQGLFTIANKDTIRVTYPAAEPVMTFFPL